MGYGNSKITPRMSVVCHCRKEGWGGVTFSAVYSSLIRTSFTVSEAGVTPLPVVWELGWISVCLPFVGFCQKWANCPASFSSSLTTETRFQVPLSWTRRRRLSRPSRITNKDRMGLRKPSLGPPQMDFRKKWPRSTDCVLTKPSLGAPQIWTLGQNDFKKTDCVLTKPSLEKARMSLRKPSQMEDRQNDQELCCDKAKS